MVLMVLVETCPFEESKNGLDVFAADDVVADVADVAVVQVQRRSSLCLEEEEEDAAPLV